MVVSLVLFCLRYLDIIDVVGICLGLGANAVLCGWLLCIVLVWLAGCLIAVLLVFGYCGFVCLLWWLVCGLFSWLLGFGFTVAVCFGIGWRIRLNNVLVLGRGSIWWFWIDLWLGG